MRFDRIPMIMLLVLAATLTVHDARAAARPFGRQSLVGVPYHKVYLPGALRTSAVCLIGQHGDAVETAGDDTSSIITFGENDSYWTFLELRPDSCPGCGGGMGGTLSAAHLALYFPFAPETINVNISVITIVPIPCHYPNYTDPGAIICDEFGAALIGRAEDSLKIVDFGVPIPGTCALNIPDGAPSTAAFLGINFVSASDMATRHVPKIALQLAAKTCISWNTVGFIAYDFVLEYADGNPIMYAEVAKCESVPVIRKTWGQLKMHYH